LADYFRKTGFTILPIFHQNSKNFNNKKVGKIMQIFLSTSEDGQSRRRQNSEEAARGGSSGSAGGSQEVAAASPPLRRSQEEPTAIGSRWRRRRWRGESLSMRLSMPPPPLPPTSLSRHPTLSGRAFGSNAWFEFRL
jgi:hypothetical protein